MPVTDCGTMSTPTNRRKSLRQPAAGRGKSAGADAGSPFKRFESSVYAFQETIRRLLRIHESFLKSIDEGFVRGGRGGAVISFNGSDTLEEADLMDALRAVSQRYDAKDFDTDTLRKHIAHDIALLKTIQKLVSPITPEKDAKLQILKALLISKPLKDAKRLIFTQYAGHGKIPLCHLNPK